MKKIFLIVPMLLFLTGCGSSDSYEYTCTKNDSTDEYDSKITLNFSFDNDKVYTFNYEIEEEYEDEKLVNDAYVNYQTLYENYNENNVDSDYKKDENKIIASYTMDKSDIDSEKIKVSFDFAKKKKTFLDNLVKDGYTCKEN